MDYVIRDEDGNLTGAYVCFGVPPEEHADFAVECTPEQRLNWPHYHAVYVERQIGENVIQPAEDAPEGTEPTIEPIMGMVWELELLPPPEFDLVGARDRLVRQIDTDADRIYGAVIGNRVTEYTMAEADAVAFAAAEYSGAVPASVECWAEVKGQTAQWAADDILATAAAWRQAQAAIRASRLAHKEQARLAEDEAGVDTVRASWAGFVGYISTQLGVA